MIPHEKEEKNTIEETTRIGAKSPHQMGHVVSGQEEGEKQVAFPVEEWMGSVHTNATREGPNGRGSKDLTPNPSSCH